jgi:hypothetical protein
VQLAAVVVAAIAADEVQFVVVAFAADDVTADCLHLALAAEADLVWLAAVVAVVADAFAGDELHLDVIAFAADDVTAASLPVAHAAEADQVQGAVVFVADDAASAELSILQLLVARHVSLVDQTVVYQVETHLRLDPQSGHQLQSQAPGIDLRSTHINSLTQVLTSIMFSMNDLFHNSSGLKRNVTQISS